jgi:cellobiose-specific phosphotransferase system component IIC
VTPAAIDDFLSLAGGFVIILGGGGIIALITLAIIMRTRRNKQLRKLMNLPLTS